MSQKFEMIWANNARLELAIQMQEHSHLCYQLYMVEEGDHTFVINGTELAIAPGDIFYIPPNTPHRMLPSPKYSVWRGLELKFFIHDQYILSQLPTSSVVFRGDEMSRIMLHYVHQNWKNRDEQNITNIDCILHALMSCFFIGQTKYPDSDRNIIDTSPYSPITRAVATYIETKYYKHFSMEKMAQELNYNKNYLSSAFSKSAGISIVEYLNLIRIRQAVIVFCYYDRDVFTTCKTIGFSNASHFSRTFKDLVGVSPRTFRRAFSSPDRQQISRYFLEEPILNYQLCTLEEAFASLRRLGEAAKTLTEKLQTGVSDENTPIADTV